MNSLSPRRNREARRSVLDAAALRQRRRSDLRQIAIGASVGVVAWFMVVRGNLTWIDRNGHSTNSGGIEANTGSILFALLLSTAVICLGILRNRPRGIGVVISGRYGWLVLLTFARLGSRADGNRFRTDGDSSRDPGRHALHRGRDSCCSLETAFDSPKRVIVRPVPRSDSGDASYAIRSGPSKAATASAFETSDAAPAAPSQREAQRGACVGDWRLEEPRGLTCQSLRESGRSAARSAGNTHTPSMTPSISDCHSARRRGLPLVVRGIALGAA